MLEEFRELVRAGILRVTPENEVLSVKEPSASGAGTEKQTPPGSREEDVALLDKQLLEWLDRKRQQKEGARRREPLKPLQTEAAPAGLRQKVVERLANKILELWDRPEQSTEMHSLRESVIERIAEEMLKRWQRSLE
jgi:hypothetical protein